MKKKELFVSDIIDNTRKICQVLNQQSKKAERETGITGQQLYAIKFIKDMAPVRVCDLASRMYLHPATVIGILDRLESKGFIKRGRSREDRRVVKVELTKKGKNILIKAPEVAQNLSPGAQELAARLEKLPIKKLQEIESSLKQLADFLSTHELASQEAHSGEVNKSKRQQSMLLCF